jgi:hypothetical protein
MGAWVGSRSPGDIESGDGVLNEIDHALAALGTAHWMENSRATLTGGIGDKAPQSSGSFGGTKSGSCRPLAGTEAYFVPRKAAVGTEQCYARMAPNNATRLSRIEWLWP